MVDLAVGDEWAAKVENLESEVDEVLQEEQQEKQLNQAEMQVTRGENLIKHEDEIKSRPKRTWFESEREKRESKKRSRAELNGPDSVRKKEKRKLSGKDKKKLDGTRDREEGKVWKKGKTERESKEIPAKAKGKGKGKAPKKGGRKS